MTNAKTLTITKPNGRNRFALLVNGRSVVEYEFSDCAGYPVENAILDRKAWKSLQEWVKKQPATEMEIPGLPDPALMPFNLNSTVHELYNREIFGVRS